MSSGAHSSKSKAHNKARLNKGKSREINFISETAGQKEARRSLEAQARHVETVDAKVDFVLDRANRVTREQQRPGRRER